MADGSPQDRSPTEDSGQDTAPRESDADGGAGRPSGGVVQGVGGAGVQGGAAGMRAGGLGPEAGGHGGTPAAGAGGSSGAIGIPAAPPFSCAGVNQCSTFEQKPELENDGHWYWKPFWCHPSPDCMGRVEPEPETKGAANNVFLSTLAEPAGPNNRARQLGTSLNHDSERYPFSRVIIEFDYWAFTPVDETDVVWFFISDGRDVLRLKTSGSKTYAQGYVDGTTTWTGMFQSPPPGTRQHIRIEITRNDAQNCTMALSYGSADAHVVFSHALFMPAGQPMEATPYDVYLGLSVPADDMTLMVSARYDNFKSTSTAWDGP